MSSSTVLVLIEIFDDSLTTLVPRNHVTSGLGFALHLHFMVISVPFSFGMMRGFSMKDGAEPPSSASWKDPRLDVDEDTSVASGCVLRHRKRDLRRGRGSSSMTIRDRAITDDVSRVVGSSMRVTKRTYRDFHDLLAIARLCLPGGINSSRSARSFHRKKSLVVFIGSAIMECIYISHKDVSRKVDSGIRYGRTKSSRRDLIVQTI